LDRGKPAMNADISMATVRTQGWQIWFGERRAKTTATGGVTCTFTQGEMHGNAKLTEHDVQLIRAASGGQAAIAEQFEVSQSLVSMIRARKRWAHIQ